MMEGVRWSRGVEEKHAERGALGGGREEDKSDERVRVRTSI